MWAAVLLAWLAPPTASAHEFWLCPSTYRAVPGDTIAVSAYVGSGFRGELKPYASPRVVRFRLVGPKTLDLTPAVVNGELRWAFFIVPDDGGELLAYESNFTFLELAAPRFETYLRSEGLDDVLAARARLGAPAGPGRERYARCAKTWIAGRQASRALSPIGLTLEIVPLADPGAGPRLPVQVLYRGRPLAHALVRAWNRELARGDRPVDPAARDSVAPAGEVRTDAEGKATLAVDRPGEWLLNTVHMIPSEDPAQADWQSWWASFAFARQAKGHAAPGEAPLGSRVPAARRRRPRRGPRRISRRPEPWPGPPGE